MMNTFNPYPKEYYQDFRGVMKPTSESFQNAYYLARALTDIALNSDYLSEKLLENTLALMDTYEILDDAVRESVDGFLLGVDDTCREALNHG